MTRAVAAGLVAVTVVALVSACAPERTPGWKPIPWAVEGTIADAPAPAVDAIPTVPQRLRGKATGIEARWEYLPGQQPVNELVARLVRAAVSSQVNASGTAYAPAPEHAGAGLGDRGCVAGSTTVPAAEVLASTAATTGGAEAASKPRTVVACDVVRAAGSVFAERLRVVAGTASTVTADTTTVVYADTATDRTGTGRELFADRRTVWKAVVEVLRRAAGSLSLVPVADPSEDDVASFLPSLDAAVVDGAGIVIPVPVGFDAAELEGLAGVPAATEASPVHVAIDGASLRAALSPLGTAVVEARGAYTGPKERGPGFDRVDCDLTPCMALTLDDGPSSYTPGILDTLKAEHSAATFFMLGRNAQNHRSTVRRVADEGHEIGNHTWDHSYLTTLTDAQVKGELDRTAQLLRSLSGQRVAIFRPPGGYIDDTVLKIAGEPAILWSVDTRDWAGPADADLLAYAVERPKAGTIMLMHDIQPVTSRVFADVVSGLRDRGFSLVTVDRLFDGHVPSGIVRYRQ